MLTFLQQKKNNIQLTDDYDTREVIHVLDVRFRIVLEILLPS